MIVEVSGLARADLDEIFDYYENRQPGLGQRFIDELHQVAARIVQFPRGWAAVSRRSRRCQFHDFPYAAYYQINGDAAVIFAIWHLHRRDEWRKRERLDVPRFRLPPSSP